MFSNVTYGAKMLIPQVESITKLARDHKAVFKKLEKGPVFLAQRSQVSAVVLSAQDYEQLALDAQRWRRQDLADKRAQELKDNPNLAVSLDQLERGLVNA